MKQQQVGHVATEGRREMNINFAVELSVLYAGV
jgi:hypothetical protein